MELTQNMSAVAEYGKKIFGVITHVDKDDTLMECIKETLIEMKLSKDQMETLYLKLYVDHVQRVILYTPRTLNKKVVPVVEEVRKKIKGLYGMNTDDLTVEISTLKKGHAHVKSAGEVYGYHEVRYENGVSRHYIYLNRYTHAPFILKEVIAHEMAHYVCEKLYGNTVEMHGPEWVLIAKSLGSEGTAVSKKSYIVEPEIYRYRIDGKLYLLSEKQFKLIQNGRKTKRGLVPCTFLNGKINKDAPYELIRPISYSETNSRRKA